jgi:hypothetical protein
MMTEVEFTVSVDSQIIQHSEYDRDVLRGL